MQHVLPLRDRASDFVRACGEPYCDLIIRDLLWAVADAYGSDATFVEAGASLGDCAFWARAVHRMKAVLYEPVLEAAECVRASVQANGWTDVLLHQGVVRGTRGTAALFVPGAALGHFAHATTSPGGDSQPRKVPSMLLGDGVKASANGKFVVKIIAYNDTVPALQHMTLPHDRIIAYAVLLQTNYVVEASAYLAAIWDIFATLGPGFTVRVPELSAAVLSRSDFLALLPDLARTWTNAVAVRGDVALVERAARPGLPACRWGEGRGTVSV